MPDAAPQIAVIDYDAGNTLSVTRALEKVGAGVDLTSDPDRVKGADAVLLPGVGAFGDCMEKLAERGMDAACREAFRSGLGLLPGSVRRFKAGDLKVPHMGWNELRLVRDHPVLSGLDGEDFYFVHSYYPEPEEPADLLGETEYGVRFCAAAGRENLVAVQFHPEKSSRAGLGLYENFLAWSRTL